MVDGHLLHGLVGGLLLDGGGEDVGEDVHGDGREGCLRARLGGGVRGLGVVALGHELEEGGGGGGVEVLGEPGLLLRDAGGLGLDWLGVPWLRVGGSSRHDVVVVVARHVLALASCSQSLLESESAIWPEVNRQKKGESIKT